jgi:hypothetical protein
MELFIFGAGNSKAAAKILRKADRPELAIRTCLDNYDFQAAADIARSVDVEGYTPSAVTTLMKDAIKEQIANQDGTKSLWDASNLYYNAGSFPEAAQCLFQVFNHFFTITANKMNMVINP